MTDAELLAIAEAADAKVSGTTITFRDWLTKIQKQKGYQYKTTAWYAALDGLTQPDKNTLVAILDAAERELQPGPDPPPDPTPIPGALANGVSFGGIGYPDSQRSTRQKMIADVKAMGGKVIRVQWWGQPECNNAIQDILDAGLVPFVTVMIEYATTKISEQRAYDEGRQFTDIWGDVLRHLSFWNEPDLAGWDPEPWANCQLGFRNGVRSSTKGRNLFIWSGDIWTWKMNSGSTTDGNYAWMVRAYDQWKARGLTGMPGDGFSPHAYGDFSWNDPRNALFGIWGPNGDGKAINCIRHLMDERGDAAKPIASTECGNNVASAQPPAVNAMFDLRARGMQQGPLVYCQWDDAAGTFGMRPAEGQPPRPAYSTYTSRAGGVSTAIATPTLATRLLSAFRSSQPKSPTELLKGRDPWRPAP